MFGGVLFEGIFLMIVGDYCYLFGWVEDGELWMFCFDGVYVFLFCVEMIEFDFMKEEFVVLVD